MIILAFAALQSVQGLSAQLPHDETLRFVFVRDSRISHPRVSGVSVTPTDWSARKLLQIVQSCGGKGAAVSGDNGRSISVNARSAESNFAVARCVRESTSYRFRVGIRESGFASVQFDQEPFRSLWDS